MKKYIAILIVLFMSFETQAQKHKKLGYRFDTQNYNFGDVEQWHNQPAIFTFTNKTKKPVTFLPIFSENDLDVVLPEKAVAVGESVVIKAMYYTAGKGSFNRSFKIYFGSYDKPIILRIIGNIKSLSPEAYIQCPMSKPELAKSKIELIGDVAEIDTEIPIKEAIVVLSSLNSNKEFTLYTDNRGKFNTKLPVGNYFVSVSHPNYVNYNGSIYVGQTSPPLRIRLTPLTMNPLIVENTYKPKNETEKVLLTEIEEEKKQPKIIQKQTEKIDKEEEPVIIENEKEEIEKREPKKNEGLDREIEYVKNEPKDNLYTQKPKNDEVPRTLTTYKPSDEGDDNEDEGDNEEEDEEEDEAKTEIADNIEPDDTEDVKRIIKKKDNDSRPKTDEEEVLEESPKYIKNPKKEKEVELPKNTYTFRVLNKKTLEPIKNASIRLQEIFDKQRKHKNKTDERGFSVLEIEKQDYIFFASAEGFVSDEIRITKEDNSDVFRIELTPMSDIFDEVYDAKKKEQEDKDVLEQFSFGKTEFTFAEKEAKDELEKAKLIEQENQLKDALDNKRKQDSLNLFVRDLQLDNIKKEKELERIALEDEQQRARVKEDSLNAVIAQINLENERKEKLEKIEEEQQARIKKEKKAREIDSLNLYIKELLAENNNLEKDLDKTNTENDVLEDEKNRNRETIETLNAKNNELENPIEETTLSKTKYVANNILFLIDVSTSMGKMQKIEMLKKSIKNLSYVLRDIDRVAIISYNQKSNVVLESVSGDNTEVIISAIDSLKTGGLTNGVRGITAAYEMLEYYFIPGGNNQIILATDGLFSKYNNEMTAYELNQLVKRNAAKDMNLTVVGFGKEKEGKELMTKLAKNGEGQYIQIQNEWMTKDILIKEIQLNSKKVD